MYGMYGMYPMGMLYGINNMYAPGVNVHQQLKARHHIEPTEHHVAYVQTFPLGIVPRSNDQSYKNENGIVRFLRRSFQ
ncbi:hypothetical protein IKB17_07310 [bacterium]|nr:hypothetical protein [bacterium]